MATASTTLRLEVGKPQVGVWCARCMLPSALVFPILRISESGVSTIGTTTLCTEHEDDE